MVNLISRTSWRARRLNRASNNNSDKLPCKLKATLIRWLSRDRMQHRMFQHRFKACQKLLLFQRHNFKFCSLKQTKEIRQIFSVSSPTIRYEPPVTERVPLDSKSLW